MVHWRFPKNDGGPGRGLNDTFAAKFRGTRIPSLAREIGQNSLDAILKQNQPVRIDFKCFTIPKSRFPHATEYEAYLKACLDYRKKINAKSDIELLQNAYDCFQQDKITFLRISDHNTTGLSKDGIEDKWEGLIRSIGTSNKGGTKGGSFGIGKAAPFACSKLMTVFYSTYTMQGAHQHQGVTQLASFMMTENGELVDYQNIGYYCEGKSEAVSGELQLDPHFSRAEGDYGTDIYIAGFYLGNQSDWAEQIRLSFVDNFLFAINHNNLEIEVDGQQLNQATLPSFAKKNLEKMADEGIYYLTLTSSESIHEKIFDKRMDLWILADNPKSKRYVQMVRKNGMIITAWNGFSSIPFSGICWINDDAINAQLSTMETPEHDNWTSDRLENPKKAKEAKNLIKKMKKSIRQCIKKILEAGTSDTMDVAGAGMFLPDFTEEHLKRKRNSPQNDGNGGLQIMSIREENPTVMPKESNAIGKHKRNSTGGNVNYDDNGKELIDPRTGNTNSGNESGDGGITSEPNSPGNATGNNSGQRHGSKPIAMRLLSNRAICLSPKDGIYRLSIVPAKTVSNAEIKIALAGESTNYQAPVLSAFQDGRMLDVEGCIIKGLSFSKKKPVTILLTMDTSDYCSLEVLGYAVKG